MERAAAVGGNFMDPTVVVAKAERATADLHLHSSDFEGLREGSLGSGSRSSSPQPAKEPSSVGPIGRGSNSAVGKQLRVDCQEKIIFCIDVSKEMSNLSFQSKAGSPFAPLDVVKFALRLFVYNKNRLNKKHQFALVLLLDKALWVTDFTNDVDDFLKHVEKLSCLETYESFDAATLFDVILEKFPKLDTPSGDVPAYSVRAILVYGRSNCPFKWSNHESQNIVGCYPHFFVDALYIHQPPGENNLCESIYTEICELDERNLSYVYDATKNPTKVFNAMAQFLAHPLQRPLQEDADYKLVRAAEDSSSSTGTPTHDLYA